MRCEGVRSEGMRGANTCTALTLSAHVVDSGSRHRLHGRVRHKAYVL